MYRPQPVPGPIGGTAGSDHHPIVRAGCCWASTCSSRRPETRRKGPRGHKLFQGLSLPGTPRSHSGTAYHGPRVPLSVLRQHSRCMTSQRQNAPFGPDRRSAVGGERTYAVRSANGCIAPILAVLKRGTAPSKQTLYLCEAQGGPGWRAGVGAGARDPDCIW
jgi:hypothetical protein